MHDNQIWSGSAFFAAADDHMYDKKGIKPPTKPEPPVIPDDGDCDFRTGDLPSCAPLGVGYVPIQRSADPSYEPDNALTRGTLFPGLDLPFMDTANKNNPYAGTPLGELMAISFVTHELTLYLDTHPRDRQAFATMKKMLLLKKEAHARYTKLYGPVSIDDLQGAESFTWVHGPWPWEAVASRETPAPGSSRAALV